MNNFIIEHKFDGADMRKIVPLISEEFIESMIDTEKQCKHLNDKKSAAEIMQDDLTMHITKS